MNVYVPFTNVNEYACYSIIDANTIRAYKTRPNYNVTTDYTDIFINSHYLTRNGTVSFSNYATIPTCINSNLLTNETYYRNDFDSILIIFLIFTIFAIYLPLKIVIRLFRRLQ